MSRLLNKGKPEYMALRTVLGDVALSSAARTSSANSGPIAAAGTVSHAVLMIHCTAASGTTPTLDASLEESADNSDWTTVTGSSVTQLTAAGNRVATAAITKNYVRVVTTIGGTTPSFTFSATLLMITSS